MLFLSPSLVVSYNYANMVSEEVIRLAEGRIINMHISYLPWNRGSDPNFWSFIEDTPKGVTIHALSAKLDRGDILLQKELFFDESVETFQSTYESLNREIVALFQEHFGEIKAGKLIPYSQKGRGSFHKRKDFVDFMAGKKLDWERTIREFKEEIRKEAESEG